jgi:UDP-N-acetylenolpyruvoylglucosamine reductase
VSVAPPHGVAREHSLARYTTVRTGGPAEFFARAGSEERLAELLAWAAHAELEVAVIGSGSNMIVADEGVRGLVLKLDEGLARIEDAGAGRLECGGAARLPAVAAQASRLGLTGIEFGVNIPGTVGGAVRMNANAYDGQLATVLEWVVVVDGAGSTRRAPEELGFGYRRSNLQPGEIVARARFMLRPADPEQVRATLAEMRARRRAAQPSGIRTFGSTFKNPEGERSAGLLLAEAGCQGLRVGGVRFSPKHANFVENLGEGSTAEVVALMAEGRRQVLERFGVALEREVQALGPVRFPWEQPSPE